MAFLQICRRHRPVFGAGYSLERLLTGRSSFSSCFLLHHNVEFAPTCLGKNSVDQNILVFQPSRVGTSCALHYYYLCQSKQCELNDYEMETSVELSKLILYHSRIFNQNKHNIVSVARVSSIVTCCTSLTLQLRYDYMYVFLDAKI